MAPVPTWDIADRLRKSLREADIGVQEMANYLQVARNTVSTWINGRIEPSAQTVRLWALRTGVPFEWLCHGDLSPCDIRPRGIPRTHAKGSNYMHSNLTGTPAHRVAA